MKAKLGKKYRDKITGIIGTATSITEYLYGCRRVGLTTTNGDGDVKDWVFDEPGLEEVKEAKRVAPRQNTGGPHDRSPVARRGHL
jgi:hypothetical protein